MTSAPLRKTASSDVESSPTPPLKVHGSRQGVDAIVQSEKSYGVQLSEGASLWMTPRYIIGVFCFIALAAFVVSLDQYTSGTVCPATSSAGWSPDAILNSTSSKRSPPLSVSILSSRR
jgi:hypothetical protein